MSSDFSSERPSRSGLARVVIVRRSGWPGSACHLFPDLACSGVLAGLAGWLALIGWWLFFSRAGWYERLGASS